MKLIFSKKRLFILFILFLFSGGTLFSQSSDRYFDKAEPTFKEVRLAILYPSIGSIKSLVELRKQSLFPQENLIVIGVYHQKERTNLEESKEFIKENNMEWFKFHQVSGELNKDILFQKNSCTEDFKNIFQKSDGIIFFGGADIPPSIYRSKTNLLTHISTPYRHFLELSFIFHLLGGFQEENFKAFLGPSPKFPILGICLGAQSLNVGTGGTLTQDIWSVKYGKKYFEDVIGLGRENWHANPLARLYPEEKLLSFNMHPIRLIENGKFCSEIGFNKDDTPYILSAHHQMADKLGKRIRIAATSLDGKVVEAIEHEEYPNVFGVQFHPEFPNLWDHEEKFRFTPQDKEEKSLLSVLESNPPSLAFHKKIWSWFSQKLKEYHESKK
ncbi:MAG: hypothetical protein GTO17_09095 [Candidatus Aminicenantes bacterium]|nr:hypothetical protein [Candidatus Aminicenantes bacterium]